MSVSTLEFAELDPHSLVLADNVRDRVDLDADPAFVDSIRAHGVMHAITAVRRDDGSLVVEDGQRRLLASLSLGLDTVPVVIRPDTPGAAAAREIARIARQIESSDRREAITAGQRAAGIAQMLDLGASVTAITKTTHVSRETVRLAARIGRCAAARDALDAGQLDLEQAAVIGAFESEGDQDAVRDLLAAPASMFRYTAQRITDARRETRLRAEHAASYAAQGFEILTAQPDPFDTASGCVPAEDLLTVDGGEVTRAVIDTTPTAWAVWLSYERAGMLVDPTTGDEVAEDTVDWSTQDEPDTTPAPGLRHAGSVEERDRWIPDFYARDLTAAGVRPAAPTAAPPASDAGGDEPHAGHVERAADEEVAAARRREHERAERRRVLAYNKWGLAAQAVRREWLARLLARKTAPADAAGFVAAALARDPHLLTQNKARETTATLLGITAATGIGAAITAASPARAQVLILALVLGAYEARTTKDAWRGGYYTRDVPTYLRFLAENGHALAPIEELTAGLRTGEQMPALD